MKISEAMITLDCLEPQELAQWWAAVLGVEVVQDFGVFVVVGAEPIVLGFQRVPDVEQGKNRVHIDFASQNRSDEIERLVGMGASVVGEHSAPGLAWTVLQDPAGNEFCVR
ncbi:MAG TPA: VOC family protein [Streptomyces sp.]|nr:VOC family protein [Streptomyces sp.]